jgi:hypothetical protein
MVMAKKSLKQKRTIGAFLKIPLEHEFHTYAMILEDNFAFYDIHTPEELNSKEIITKPVLFITAVYDYAVTKGRWRKTGFTVSIEENFLTIPPRYTQDILNPDKYEIYHNGKARPATKEECIGLEYFMVWTPEEIENRLNDHYQGRKNKYVEKMHKAELYPFLIDYLKEKKNAKTKDNEIELQEMKEKLVLEVMQVDDTMLIRKLDKLVEQEIKMYKKNKKEKIECD